MNEKLQSTKDCALSIAAGVGFGLTAVIAIRGLASLGRDIKDAVNEKIDSWEKDL